MPLDLLLSLLLSSLADVMFTPLGAFLTWFLFGLLGRHEAELGPDNVVEICIFLAFFSLFSPSIISWIALVGYLTTYFGFHELAVNAVFPWASNPNLYLYHPVNWARKCPLPFPFFDRLLVSYAEYDAVRGALEIDRLIDHYPSQRNAALRARAILIVRRAAETPDLARLDEILAGLPEGKQGFLWETAALRHRVHQITALQARIDTLDRPFLREPYAALLSKEIETFEQQAAGVRPPLSTEFRKAARIWAEIARRQYDATQTAVSREPIRQVFRAGDPVNRESEAFVLRASILRELERQVMLASGCPGLLVYGRRRMGKSSLVRNLIGFLPPRVAVANLSMQDARAFTSITELVGLIHEGISASVPKLPLTAPDLVGLGRLLAETDKRLEADDRRLLLAFDEYENIDRKIGEGVFPEDLLSVVRESIQNHRRLIWTLAGSHRIDELEHAPWSSYLVSARTVEVTPFEIAETRLLLTEPLKQSPLFRTVNTEPPGFEPGFWGNGGIESIQAETGGWPHLVQLVAERVVDLVNDNGATGADAALLERAFERSAETGYSVFHELVERESGSPEELLYLRGFALAETQPIPDDETARALRRRLLVIEEGDHYRLRAPIMARWLRR